MTTQEQITNFLRLYNNRRSPLPFVKPLWIYCRWLQIDVNGEVIKVVYGCYDVRNNDARRAFCALCHIVFHSTELWQIITQRSVNRT